jgi:hypothetical protein
VGGAVTAVLSPAAFRAAHPDATLWSAIEHDTYRHLIEVAALHDHPATQQPASGDDDIVWGRS